MAIPYNTTAGTSVRDALEGHSSYQAQWNVGNILKMLSQTQWCMA